MNAPVTSGCFVTHKKHTLSSAYMYTKWLINVKSGLKQFFSHANLTISVNVLMKLFSLKLSLNKKSAVKLKNC